MLGVWAIFSGCAHNYVARQVTLEKGTVPAFTGTKAVAVLNVQDSTEPFLMGQMGIHSYNANLHEWTDTAVDMLEKELKDKGISVSDGAKRQLKLTVKRANVHWGMVKVRCITDLKVETGDGYSNDFTGDAASGWTLFKACDRALARAVGEALNDDKILKYLAD